MEDGEAGAGWVILWLKGRNNFEVSEALGLLRSQLHSDADIPSSCSIILAATRRTVICRVAPRSPGFESEDKDDDHDENNNKHASNTKEDVPSPFLELGFLLPFESLQSGLVALLEVERTPGMEGRLGAVALQRT